ncbi:MAG: helix-turn-helix domain-containing protein [Deltaproteobacteria bacterium]|jgi:predicted DNA-binding transcriptional regulator AlpA|nr:helix-turn-helix domain-containing protein [Deltaproteobacteria bacterium]
MAYKNLQSNLEKVDSKDRMLRPNEAAQYLGISTSTLFAWGKEGKGPKGKLLGARTRVFTMKELQEFVANAQE